MRCLLLILILSLVGSQSLANGEYNFGERKKYYLSNDFKKDWKKYCYFQTNLVSSYRHEVKSLNEAYRVIALVADLPNKFRWDGLIDSKESQMIYAGDNSVGMIYHLAYKGINDSFFKKDRIITDYYRERFSKNSYKGCILYTNSLIKLANFEYKIVQEKNKVYVERTARVVPSIIAPKFFAMKKLESVNKRRLDEIIEII